MQLSTIGALPFGSTIARSSGGTASPARSPAGATAPTRTRSARPPRAPNRGTLAPDRRRLLGEHLVDELDADRALAHRGGDALDAAGADVADREHAGPAGLEKQRQAREGPARGRQGGGIEIGPRPHESLLVEGDAVPQPRRVRVGARHEEDVPDVRRRRDPVPVAPRDSLQPRAALQRNDAGFREQRDVGRLLDTVDEI